MQQCWHFYCFTIIGSTSIVIHSVKQHLLRNQPRSGSCDLSRLLAWKITKGVHSCKPALLNCPMEYVSCFTQSAGRLSATSGAGTVLANVADVYRQMCTRLEAGQWPLLPLHGWCPPLLPGPWLLQGKSIAAGRQRKWLQWLQLLSTSCFKTASCYWFCFPISQPQPPRYTHTRHTHTHGAKHYPEN